MKREILEVLYQKAEAQCHINEAWVFEEKFAEEIVNHCATILYDNDSYYGKWLGDTMKLELGVS